jgi:hypothetical protein
VAPAHFRPGKQSVSSNEEEQYICPWDVEHSPNPVIFPWLRNTKLTEKKMVDESCEALQVMAMSTTQSPQAASSLNAGCTFTDEPSLGTPTEYTSSPPSSYHTHESPEDMGQTPSLSPREAASPLTRIPPGKAEALSNLQCDVCQTTYETQGQLKWVASHRHIRPDC